MHTDTQSITLQKSTLCGKKALLLLYGIIIGNLAYFSIIPFFFLLDLTRLFTCIFQLSLSPQRLIHHHGPNSYCLSIEPPTPPPKKYQWFAHLILAQNEWEWRTLVIPVCKSKSGEISGQPVAEWLRATCPDVWRVGSSTVKWEDAISERLPGSSQSSWTSRTKKEKKKHFPFS